MLDILFVTYNSEKWLENCVSSIAQSDYDLKKVTLNFFDNQSRDHTVRKLEELKKRFDGVFGAFRIAKGEENLGFGAGNNRAAAMGSGEYVFCLNTDTTLYPDALKEVMEEAERASEDAGLWELRQFPYEHPKFYDPLTRETFWSSGACFVMRRSLFEKLGGFDENIFMYAEDVDLSFRIRVEGYKLIYTPKAVVNHYCYESAGQIKPTQYVYSLINNLYLRYKFGSDEQIREWYQLIQNVYQAPEPFDGANARLLQAFSDMGSTVSEAQAYNRKHQAAIQKCHFEFIGFDYSINRDGAFFVSKRPDADKKVSVIVRTCGRPQVLREALKSLRSQTYRNFEVIVEEDGLETAGEMIRREFSDLDIRYEATGRKVGRCKAGNMALARATGDYFNFLDDDDLFYADHLETLVKELQEHPEMHAAYSFAFDTPIVIISKNPYIYRIPYYNKTVREKFNRVLLCHHNLFPIQAVLFERQIYEELGGFDESLDVLEDWDLWVRYASRYEFYMVEKTTSVYRLPPEGSQDEKRQRQLDEALQQARARHADVRFECTAAELLKDYEAITILPPVQGAPPPVEPAYKKTLIYRVLRKIYHLLIGR